MMMMAGLVVPLFAGRRAQDLGPQWRLQDKERNMKLLTLDGRVRDVTHFV